MLAMGAPVDRLKSVVGRRVRRLAGQPDLQRRIAELEKRVATLEKAGGGSTKERRRAARKKARTSGLGGTAPDRGAPAAAQTAEVEAAVVAVKEQRLTYLTLPALRALAVTVDELERDELPGIIVEAGTALGGSAVVIALSKSPERRFVAHDMFGLIPPPGDEDGDDVHERYATIVAGRSSGLGGDTYYGYREDLLGEVTATFDRFGVPVDQNAIELVPGLFQDTISGDEPIALAHVDGDWYESTMVCLERFGPRIVPGGRFVIDDYFSWSGCRTAVEEYFTDRDGWSFEQRGGKVHIVRAAADPHA